jgi:hypothetical protein
MQPTAAVTTNAQGEARFTIATDEVDGFGTASLIASIASPALSADRKITIATRGFSIDLSTVRPAFVTGESIDVAIKTVDAANQPASQKLLVKVTRQLKVGDTTRDEPVEEHPLATAADGTAKLTLKPAKGGHYTITASGTDRFGNEIKVLLEVRVAGEDDPERLLLLVDRTELKAGETAEMQLHWRGEPATAVVTTHYDRLREHRLVELRRGSNRLAIPITAAMAPGFTLSVAAMDQGTKDAPSTVGSKDSKEGPANGVSIPARTLQEAECDFTVDPNLQVKIESHRHGDAKAKPRPGDAVDVTITTSDAQGKPLPAEVGLDILPADRDTGDLGSPATMPRFSLGRGHSADFRTASSIRFHYLPVHRIIAMEVLEADSRKIPAEILAQAGVNAAPARRAPVPTANDDPFGPEVPAVTTRTPSASIEVRPARAVDEADPFGRVPARPVDELAPAVRRVSPRRFETSAVTRSPQPSWPGYWNPAIMTGPDGRATITITPPDDATE